MKYISVKACVSCWGCGSTKNGQKVCRYQNRVVTIDYSVKNYFPEWCRLPDLKVK